MATQKDLVSQLTGNFGKWQLKALLIIFLCKIPTSWFMAVVLFSAPAPQAGEFWCRPPNHVTNHTAWIEASHPLVRSTVHNRISIDFCNVYREIYNADDQEALNQNATAVIVEERNSSSVSSQPDIVPCKEFFFNTQFRSVVTDYGLVCGRKFLAALAQSFHIFGLLVGGIVAFYCLKQCSPRRLMLIGMFMQIVCGSMCGLVGLYELHVLFRFLTAIACALMYTSGQLILSDITGGRAKLLVTILFELFWSIGLILLPAVSIFLSDWTNLYHVLSLPTLILVFLHRLIPDSPRWMLAHKRLGKAKEILIKAARSNKREIPKDLNEQLMNFASIPIPPQVTWLKLWKGLPKMRYVLCVHYAFAVYILLFNSMVLNIAAYGQKHIHMNTVVMALSEIAGVALAVYIIMYTKKKWLWAGLLSIAAGLFANIVWIIPTNLKDTHIVALTMIPCIFIKIATSTSMAVLTTSSADLVSPDKKKILMFSCAIWARGWFLWAPFIGATSFYGVLVPLTIFAAMSVIGGLLNICIYQGQCEQERTAVDMTKAIKDKESFLPKSIQEVGTVPDSSWISNVSLRSL